MISTQEVAHRNVTNNACRIAFVFGDTLVIRSDNELNRQRVAEPAADARLVHVAGTFRAMCPNANFRSQEKQRLFKPRDQLLVFAGVRLKDLRYGALLAHVPRPSQLVVFKQAAAFHITTAIIIAVKMPAFFAGWGNHQTKL